MTKTLPTHGNSFILALQLNFDHHVLSKTSSHYYCKWQIKSPLHCSHKKKQNSFTHRTLEEYLETGRLSVSDIQQPRRHPFPSTSDGTEHCPEPAENPLLNGRNIPRTCRLQLRNEFTAADPLASCVALVTLLAVYLVYGCRLSTSSKFYSHVSNLPIEIFAKTYFIESIRIMQNSAWNYHSHKMQCSHWFCWYQSGPVWRQPTFGPGFVPGIARLLHDNAGPCRMSEISIMVGGNFHLFFQQFYEMIHI